MFLSFSVGFSFYQDEDEKKTFGLVCVCVGVCFSFVRCCSFAVEEIGDYDATVLGAHTHTHTHVKQREERRESRQTYFLLFFRSHPKTTIFFSFCTSYAQEKKALRMFLLPGLEDGRVRLYI